MQLWDFRSNLFFSYSMAVCIIVPIKCFNVVLESECCNGLLMGKKHHSTSNYYMKNHVYSVSSNQGLALSICHTGGHLGCHHLEVMVLH